MKSSTGVQAPTAQRTACVRTEDPIEVAPAEGLKNEPEPDFCVTYQPLAVEAAHPPQPAEVRLIVEMADSTFDFDRKVKAGLYARAGIREYWVVDVRDIAAPRLLLHQDPQNGSYRTVEIFLHTSHLSVLEGRSLCLAQLI